MAWEGVLARMKHRHLHDNAGLTLPSLDDILEYGGPEDWLEVRRAIDAEQFGEVAENVLSLCRHHEMYGTSRLWIHYVERSRRRNRKTETVRGR